MKTILPIVITLLAVPAFAQEKKEDVSSVIRQAEDRWEAATIKQDNKTVAELLASDYAGVSNKGQREDKAALLSRYDKEGKQEKYTSAQITDLKVHVYGPNVAVAIGDAVEKGTDKDGKAFDRVYRFTDTWMKRDDRWQCIAEQSSELKEKR